MPILHDEVTISSNQYSMALLICNRIHCSLHSIPMNDWLVYTHDEHCMMLEFVRTWMASPVADQSKTAMRATVLQLAAAN